MKEFVKQLSIIDLRPSGWESEKEHYHEGDFTITTDVSLDAHIETLEYNGITKEQIIAMNKARYGNVVDFFYIHEKNPEDSYYIMALGAR